MADRHTVDIRLEAAMAKMWNSEVGWRIVDDLLQIKGGRGYETADSLRSRGERPDPVERMMRDYRINLIFEGSSEIMRLFIAREAVDTHLKVAGALIDPKSSTGTKVKALFGAGAFYALWYPKLWIGLKGCVRVRLRSARHAPPLRGRRSRKLARSLFHAMIRFGPKLEKRQTVLFRLVDVGAELFAMTAAISRAETMARAGNREAIEVADVFCRHARTGGSALPACVRAGRRGDLPAGAAGGARGGGVAGGGDCARDVREWV